MVVSLSDAPRGRFDNIKFSLRRLFRPLLFFLSYDLCCILIFGIEKPDINSWFFDDAFVLSNGLQHFIDFRPGYPPLGKLPYTLLYGLFRGGEPVILYNIVMLNIVIYVTYRLLNRIATSREKYVLTALVAVNPVIFQALALNHADIPALLFFLLGLYGLVRKNPLEVGVFSSLGFLTKIYPALLAIPAFLMFRKWNEKWVLIASFVCTSLLISAPFLVSDPLMYASTYLSHLGRGPSESIFALIDGYFSHTGFRHPTYEAAIYSWQFDSIYPPSSYDSFRYAWTYPYLKSASTLLQLGFLLVFSIMAMRKQNSPARLKKASAALLSYFMFSAFWNPLLAIPVFMLAILLVLGKGTLYQLLAISSLIAVDAFHYLVWVVDLPVPMELSLLTVVSLRGAIFSIILLTCWRS